eukprot:1438-Eustigmatos_ZCMA.PRE.1
MAPKNKVSGPPAWRQRSQFSLLLSNGQPAHITRTTQRITTEYSARAGRDTSTEGRQPHSHPLGCVRTIIQDIVNDVDG